MTILESILLGIIQGITEFLPISSTAHLTLAGKLLNIVESLDPEDWTAFMAIMQLGTAAAVILYFLNDYVSILKGLLLDLRLRRLSKNAAPGIQTKLAGKILLGTVPIVIIAWLFKDFIRGTFTKELSTIGTSLIVLALFLLWGEKRGTHRRKEEDTTWKDALVVGLAQAVALIPGASRSGTTITAGLFLGLERETAAKFSFHLSIPAILASGLYELYESRGHLADIGLAPIIVSTLVSGIVGYLSISFLLKYLQKHTTILFIWYRIVLGLGIWIYIFSR